MFNFLDILNPNPHLLTTKNPANKQIFSIVTYSHSSTQLEIVSWKIGWGVWKKKHEHDMEISQEYMEHILFHKMTNYMPMVVRNVNQIKASSLEGADTVVKTTFWWFLEDCTQFAPQIPDATGHLTWSRVFFLLPLPYYWFHVHKYVKWMGLNYHPILTHLNQIKIPQGNDSSDRTWTYTILIKLRILYLGLLAGYIYSYQKVDSSTWLSLVEKRDEQGLL